jgi:probable rRNA maturation factor
MQRNITFQAQDVNFVLPKKQIIRNWITAIAGNEDFKTGSINFIFCSDTHLLEINKQYLNHDYFTDIITFDYTEGKRLAGDIFISIDRVVDNAKEYKAPFDDELHRVIIHGILHLMGYKDKSAADEKQMRQKENGALSLLKSL